MRVLTYGTIAAVLLTGLSSDATEQCEACQLLPFLGDRQSGFAGEVLAEPIVARLIDEAGNGVFGERITFRVDGNGGRLFAESGLEAGLLVMRTDAKGDVSAWFRVGPDYAFEDNFVTATSDVAKDPVRFHLINKGQVQ